MEEWGGRGTHEAKAVQTRGVSALGQSNGIRKRTIANVSVANSTLTKPLANRISTICGGRKTIQLSVIGDQGGYASEIDADEKGPDLFDERQQSAVMYTNPP